MPKRPPIDGIRHTPRETVRSDDDQSAGNENGRTRQDGVDDRRDPVEQEVRRYRTGRRVQVQRHGEVGPEIVGPCEQARGDRAVDGSDDDRDERGGGQVSDRQCGRSRPSLPHLRARDG